MQKTKLSLYNNSPYHPGGNALKRVLWFFINRIFLKSGIVPISSFCVLLLRIFGARIGKNVVIRPGVNVKYPWLLTIGNDTWIGENVWIDNLVMVTIGSNVCLSQGCMLLTGSHNYKKEAFDLITGNVILEDGVWIGARAIVNCNITAASHSVLTTGSVATKNLAAYTIYQGNPAIKIRSRLIT